jgi:hypothetical protein
MYTFTYFIKFNVTVFDIFLTLSNERSQVSYPSSFKLTGLGVTNRLTIRRQIIYHLTGAF